MFVENIERRVAVIAAQLAHADNKKIGTIARSGYYRSAIILICSVVEGLVHMIVEQEALRMHGVINSKDELKQIHALPKSVFGRADLVIAKKVTKDLRIGDDEITFMILNRFLKRHNLVTKREFQTLEYVRKERNKLHLQGLDVPDTGYTKAKVIKISEPLDFLAKKL